ncbi:MAG: PAS domain-containing sensor histidine kinase, partial [Chitinophagaceae bacterium]
KSLFELGNGQWNIQSLRVLLEQILPTNNPVLDFEVEAEFPHIGRKLMLLNAHRIEHEGEFKNRILLSIEDITQQRESDNRKDDFISIASHELKTPLTALKGYLEVASYALKNGKEVNLEEMIDQARLSSVRLNDLLNDLLRMSKLKHEHLEINQSLFSFDEVVDEAVNMLKVSHTSHTINITARCNKHISGDRNRILQVISNLVNNAIKYSPGRNAVEVHATCHGNYVKLSVIDQGQGIPLSDQTKIFNRFFRSGVHEKSFAGMGIGLFISREIIQAHGGTIWVEKSSNLGTTFSFTLPLKQADAE